MRFYLSLFLLAALLSSCSLNKLVIRQSSRLLDYGALALYEETDLRLAEQALASNIILLEGMVKGDPQNPKLVLMATQALTGYALGFAEDTDPERAKVFYLRARDLGMTILKENQQFATALNGPVEELQLTMQNFKKDDIPLLFWTGFSWAGWINLSLDDPQAFADLPKIQIIMQRVLDLDQTYFQGATLLFFGSIWGVKPKMFGGDPEKAREYFDKNLQITKGNFLLSYIYYAKYYAIKTLDEELFNQLLDKVMTTPVDVLPEYRLLNVIAKEKARGLLSKKADIF
jgi:TRAP transporter T-component